MTTFDQNVEKQEPLEADIWDSFAEYCKEWQWYCEAYRTPERAGQLILTPKEFFDKQQQLFKLTKHENKK